MSRSRFLMFLVSFSLFSLAPTHFITFNPTSPIIGAMVGSPQDIDCIVNTTIPGVSSVSVSWTGPGGVLIMNNTNRVTISPTTSSGNIFTSSLQFDYLMEGDEGNYTCNVMILDANTNQSIELQSLNVPTPDVSITPPVTQLVGDPLTLQCEVTTVRGITSRVDIVWSSGDIELTRMKGVSSTTTNNSLVYTHSYTISQLSTTDDGRVIQCEVVIDGTSPSVMATDSITLDVTVPYPSIALSPDPIRGAMVGSPQVIICTVSTVHGVESSEVMISWFIPEGSIDETNGRVSVGSVTDEGNNTYTSSLQFDYFMEGDEGLYSCTVMILVTGVQVAISSYLHSLTIPPPTVLVTAPNTQIVGQSLTLQCEVTTVRGITSRVDIVWSSGSTELNRTDNITLTTMHNSQVYRDSYAISQLSTTDDGRVIQCEVVINTSPPIQSDDKNALDITVPTPTVTISTSGPIQGAMVGSSRVINCTVSTVNGVESSSVMISWMGPGGNIMNNSRVTISPTTSSGNAYTSSLQFIFLMEEDEGTYTCNVMILNVSGSDAVELSLNFPTPFVSITPPVTQIVGDPLELHCAVTTVRGITSRVDIVWSSGGTVLRRINGTTPTTMGNSLVYTESLSIPQLSTTDDGRVIQCGVVIDTSPSVMATDSITVDVTVPYPSIALSPDPIQGAMVGSSLNIQCTVSTVSGVESSEVMINWFIPEGSIDETNGRVSVGSVTDKGNNTYTSSLQFDYLMEGDEGLYSCRVTIRVTGVQVAISGSLHSLTIPPPTVLVTAPNTQIVGQSLTLQCEVTTVRGITSRVDIVWSSGSTELNRTDNITLTTMRNSQVYRDSYAISQLSTTDDGRVIQCEVVINTSPPIQSDDKNALDITVPTPTVTISPSGPIQGAMVGSPQNIQCTVSTVNGVESSSVIISWRGPGGNIMNNSRVTISPTTSSGNTYTSSLQFTYLMEGDEGTYTCNVMILDVSGSDSVELSLNSSCSSTSSTHSHASSDDNNGATVIALIVMVVIMAIGLIVAIAVIILLMRKVRHLKSLYKVSQREGTINEPVNISATRLRKKFGEAVYECFDSDETQHDKPVAISTTPSTANSMQENPAYEINKTRTTCTT